MKIRRHCIFYGNVQGVGFRYRARHTANLLGLTGWVKNEWDGSVILEIQGEEANVEEMIRRLHRLPYGWIDRMEMKGLEVEQESSFCVR